ncbi:MAG: hypothetical protein QOJ16_2056, partial [Acidobacteriota bacterium]|nr:hypothetical protein [Acidobacteriota bacterium]
MNLRKKIFLFTAALVSVVFVTALALVQWQVQSATVADNRQHLLATAAAVREHEQDVVRNRQERGKLLARAPRLAEALERRDPAELALLARSLRQWLPGTQLLALAAADGRILAANGFPGRLDDAGLATAEPLRSALAGGSGHGMWVVGGQLCDVVAAPVESPANGRRVGAVLVGLNVGTTALRHLRSLIQNDILLVSADGRVLASSLPAALA